MFKIIITLFLNYSENNTKINRIRYAKSARHILTKDLLVLTILFYLIVMVSLTVMTRIGKKRTLVIPKVIAEKLGLDEGCRVRIRVESDKIIMEPIYDAVWLSLHGRKIAKTVLEDLECESIEQQEKYINSK